MFFTQERVSVDGRRFRMFKFRSMVDDAEKETGPIFATSDDPRRTPVGAFLRKHNLDELPQLFNVVLGDMSLVGPRPERPPFVQQFKERIPQYMLRHRVKSGITGWAQINGLRGQHLDREADRVRPLLHRELVAAAGPEDPDPHPVPRLRPEARLLSHSGSQLTSGRPDA